MSASARTQSPANGNKAKKSKIVALSLSSDILRQFPHESTKTASTPASSSAGQDDTDMPAVKISEATDNNSDSNGTPGPGQDGDTSGEQNKKRKGPAPGTKRNSTQTSDGMLKPRGKPGPKKKPRLEDGTIDHGNNKPPNGVVVTGPTHKLGPKANQGAINAGLRALDRSGAPCRRWVRKEFSVKSFTGVHWEVPSWKGGEKASTAGSDDLTSIKDSSQQSSSDIKPAGSDIAMENHNGDTTFDLNTSPPALIARPAASSAIAAAG